MDTPVKNSPLTPKQLHFCRCLASGSTQAAAYREAYDIGEGTKPATHQQAASRLMRKAAIRARVERLIEERERAITTAAVSDREKVLGKLRGWIDPEVTVAEDGTVHKALASASELKAAELLGRSVGLFKDVLVEDRKRTSGEVAGELERTLADMLGDDESEVVEGDDAVPSDSELH